jgi:GT2 family glycosyltransferase/SAM-dependent methyltransferase/thioredoxin-like negative regulator of GroEL
MNANTDDRRLHDSVEKMVNLLEKNPEKVLVYSPYFVTDQKNVHLESFKPEKQTHSREYSQELLKKVCLPGPMPIWRRSVHDEFGYFDENFISSGDYEFWLKISQKYDFILFNEPCGVYLSHEESIEHRNRKNGIVEKENEIIYNRYIKKMEKLLLSAIVSTYNAEKDLPACLENLENQTISDKMEIIVINSGSEQNEEQIVRDFQKHFSNIKYIYTEERETVYQAWNRGVKAASGKYLSNANTDDRRFPDACEKLVTFLEENEDFALAYGNFQVTNTENFTLESAEITNEMDYPEFEKKSLLISCYPGPMPVWRASVHEEFGFFNENYKSAGDREFWARVAQKYPLKNIHETVGIYLDNTNGIGNTHIRNGVVKKEAEKILTRYQKSLNSDWKNFETAEILVDNNFEQIKENLLILENSGGAFRIFAKIDSCTLEEYLWLKEKKSEGLIEKLTFSEKGKKLFPTVSILMFTFDRLKYSEKTLHNLMKNTRYPFDLHIVDNYSTDGTDSWLKEMQLMYPETIKSITFNKKNEGLPKPTNEFWERVSTDFIGKIDNDTLVPPHWLERLVKAHQNSNKLGVVGGYHFRPEDFNESEAQEKFFSENGVNVVQDTHIGGCCYLMRRSLYKKYGPMTYDPRLKTHGWTEYQQMLAQEGYIVGYLYPLIQIDYMDDPRSEHCLIESDYREYTKEIWKERGVNFQSSDQLVNWLKRDAKRVTSTTNTVQQNSKKVAHSEETKYYGHARPEVQALVSENANLVLDLGCGSGLLGKGLKEKNPARTVVGIEYVADVAAQAREFLDEVYSGDATKIVTRFMESHFDAVVMADFLEHIADPEAMLREIRRILKPTGKLILSIPNVRHWSVVKDLLEGRWTYEDAGILDRTHLKFFTWQSLVKTLLENGFKIEKYDGTMIRGMEEIPQGFENALRNFGLNPQNLELESKIYQYLVVCEPQKDQQEEIKKSETLTHLVERNDGRPLVSLIILAFNALKFTKECIESIFKHTRYPYEIIFVDNASSDGSTEYLEDLANRFSHVKLIKNKKNRGFSGGNNQGVAAASGKYIMLLNNDIVVSEKWLSNLVSALEIDEKIGMVGPVTNYISGRQVVDNIDYKEINGFHKFASKMAEANRNRITPRRRIAGFAVLMKKSLYEEVKGLDESFGNGNFEDDDLCLKVSEKGYAIMVHEGVYIHHYGSQTFVVNKMDMRDSLKKNKGIFEKKWPTVDYEELIEIKNPLQIHESSQINEAVRLLVDGEYEKAFRMAKEIIKINPISEDGLLLYAQVHKEMGKTDDAVNVLERLVNHYPENASAYNLYAVILLSDNKIEEAERVVIRAIELNPEFLEAQLNYVEILLLREAFSEAVSALKKIVENHSDYLPALHRFYQLYIEVEQYENAEVMKKRIKELDPNFIF